MDILRMLEHLNDLAVEEPKTYFGITFGLDKEEIAMQIAKVRASLPNELKAAALTVRESERIVDSAREDATMALTNSKKEAERVLTEARALAEKIVAEARQSADKTLAEAHKEAERTVEHGRTQQERMVAESEVLKLAKAQAEEIRNSADRDAVQLRRGADKYAHDMLNQLESVVGKAMTVIERGKSEIQKPADTAAVNPREREKSRV